MAGFRMSPSLLSPSSQTSLQTCKLQAPAGFLGTVRGLIGVASPLRVPPEKDRAGQMALQKTPFCKSAPLQGGSLDLASRGNRGQEAGRGKVPRPRALLVEAEPVVWVPASSAGCLSSQGHLSKPFKRNKVTVPCEPGRETKAALLCRLGNNAGPSNRGSRAPLLPA